MDQLGWKVILSSYDTDRYLVISDLKELSTTCKYTRNKLATSLFKAILINNFCESLDDLPLNEIYSSENKSYTLSKYEDRLKSLIRYVRSIKYEYNYNEMLFLSIPIVFTNLTSLELFEAHFTLTSFNKIMNKLTQLESLYLNRVMFIVFTVNQDQITMTFPQTLKVFKISFGQITYTSYDPNLSLSNHLELSDAANAEKLKFNIEQESLPNLTVLEIDQDSEEFKETQFNLLRASSRLVRFSTRFMILEGLSQINFSCLTSLTLTNIYQSNQDFRFQTLPSIIEFKVIVGIPMSDSSQALLFDRFLNLANLGLNAKKLTFPYINSFSYTIEEILQKFTSLIELTLNSSNKIIRLSSEKFPSSIKSLKLYNIRPKFIDIENITRCPGLHAISIYYNDLTFKFEEVEHFKGVAGWEIIHFYRSSIKCYKELKYLSRCD